MSEADTEDEDEAMLRAIMDGPLSDTLLRVKAMGQSMMPGDPLFDDQASRDDALRVMHDAKQGIQSMGEEQQDASFNRTVILTPGTGDKSGGNGS